MGACATACLYWSGPAPAPAPSPRPARRARHGPHAGERHGSDRHQGFVGEHGPRPRGDVRHHGRRARGGLATLAVFPSRASDATHPVPARHTRQGRAAGSPECGEGTGVLEKGHVKEKPAKRLAGFVVADGPGSPGSRHRIIPVISCAAKIFRTTRNIDFSCRRQMTAIPVPNGKGSCRRQSAGHVIVRPGRAQCARVSQYRKPGFPFKSASDTSAYLSQCNMHPSLLIYSAP